MGSSVISSVHVEEVTITARNYIFTRRIDGILFEIMNTAKPVHGHQTCVTTCSLARSYVNGEQGYQMGNGVPDRSQWSSSGISVGF